MSELIVYSSGITDTRVLERALRAAGREYRIERMGMGDAAMRARFESLCEEAGARRLPLIRDGERWLGELELLDELNASRIPVPAMTSAVGHAGLLPFVAGTVAIALGLPLVEVWLGYAMLILAFMAGTQWGAALGWNGAPWSFWLRSVAAPLLAWPLMQTGPVLQAWGLALLFGALLALDRRLHDADRYPPGYLALRMRLSAVVMLSLALGALAIDL